MADPAEIEAVLKRFSAPRLSIGAAIASDGKRIRGANRNGEGHHETATLVEHETGLPVASHGFHDESGEIAAVQALLEDVSVAGRVITVDAPAYGQGYRPQHRRNPQGRLSDDGEGECAGNVRHPRNDQLGTGCHRVIRGGVHQGTWSH